MRIAIDISQSAYEYTGVGKFTAGLVQYICDNDSENDWTFFFSSLRNHLPEKLHEKILKHQKKLIEYPFPPRLLSLISNDIRLFPIELALGKQDWFISSDWTEPPAHCRKATIVHDLTFKKFPETVHPSIRAVQEKRLKLIKNESSLIFADSASTKEDLEDYYSIPRDKIIVNYPGVTVMRPTPSETEMVLKKYSLNKSYIVCIGKKEPRKNLGRLIKAFMSLTHIELSLVIVGPKGWDTVLKEDARIKVLSEVTESELFALYAGSLGLVFPSLYEGFGYPLVEAMNLGVPAAVSNSSSLGEIGRGSALLFDPTNTDEIATSIAELVQNERLRKTLIRAGLQSATLYTWKNYYNKMLDALNRFNK